MSKKVRKWQDLEEIVRLLASHLYNRPAKPEIINGVKCDCVVKIEPDNYAIIEVSKSSSLEKLRIDLAKFATVKPYLMSQNIYAKCIFITEADNHSSLIESGRGQNVEVMTLLEFSERLFKFSDYRHIRIAKPFGSAVDPLTGEDDKNEYTRVKYVWNNEYEIDIDKIADSLLEGKYIVLIGNYGTGKSRCIKELFKIMVNKANIYFKYPIAINLKENWGLKRSSEIISRHLSDLGMGSMLDSFMKIYNKSSVCYLLDGFDEIGAQTWSDNPERLKGIRQQSLLGVKDLIQSSKGGCIITGREHYFNNDSELIDCLGLEKKNPIFIRCKDEFTEDEMAVYLRSITDYKQLPYWLPKKPLICQMIKAIPGDSIQPLFSTQDGEYDFWDEMLDFLCEREAKINIALDKNVIKNVLLLLSRKTREKENNIGPISISEINGSFETITGNNVTDESAIVLQRLPGLGRIGSSSQDRQFIDNYILNGLRALDLCQNVLSNNYSIADDNWKNPLEEWGLKYTANKMSQNNKNLFLAYFNRLKNKNHRNKVLLGDIIASIALLDNEKTSFNGYCLTSSNIDVLDLTNLSIENISFDSCYFRIVKILNPDANNVRFRRCCISYFEGISSIEGSPFWITESIIDGYQSIENISKIKKTRLNESQKIFLTIIRKLYFQPGSGRKEAALLRGLDGTTSRKLVTKILSIMRNEDLYSTTVGSEGTIYLPIRKNTKRLKQIMDEMTLSKDPLWGRISKIVD